MSPLATRARGCTPDRGCSASGNVHRGPRPDYPAGPTVYQGEMARNILDDGKWFAMNQRALSLMGREMRVPQWHLVDLRGR